MKAAKCPNCGANISVDETKDAGICEFCGTAFVTEKVVSNVYHNTTNNQIINNYYTTSQVNDNYAKVPRRPRPRIKILLVIILFFFYIFPAVLYIIYVRHKQKQWDDKYTY